MSTLKVNTLTDTAATKSVPIEDVVNGTARAWVNFDGTFGTSPFTIANGGIRAAYNVSSVTDNGTGLYTINFTNAMPDANYCVCGMFTNGNLLAGGRFTSLTTNSVAMTNATSSNTGYDGTNLGVAVFR